MRVTDSFRDFVIDQLGNVPDLRARAMFGGIGLYASDTFFGILAADVLYFRSMRQPGPLRQRGLLAVPALREPRQATRRPGNGDDVLL
jgi:TfoX/Sxy family transcriptional regulator of competence genes